jgi:hypothetical protein
MERSQKYDGAGDGSGGRRGTVLDGRQGWVGHIRGEKAAGRCQTKIGKGKPGEGRQRKYGNRVEDGMRGGANVVAALTGVGFGRILNGLQIV